MSEDPDRLKTRLRALPVKVRNQLLFEMLAEAGATGIVTPGENGELEGLLADRTIALKYLKNKSWSVEKVRLARRFFAERTGGPAPGSHGAGTYAAGTYIDLGANIGSTTIPIARDGIVCYAVEPDLANYRLLTLNLLRNGVTDRVATHNCAIDAAEGEAAFEIAPENLGDHRLHRGPARQNAYREAERDTTTVVTRPLDSLLGARPLAGPIVVKMDIQGAEPLAFAGGDGVFSRTALLLTEYWPYGILRLGGSLEALYAAFRRYFGYGALLADDQDPETVALEPVDALIDRLGAVASETPTEAVDLVLAREPLRFVGG